MVQEPWKTGWLRQRVLGYFNIQNGASGHYFGGVGETSFTIMIFDSQNAQRGTITYYLSQGSAVFDISVPYGTDLETVEALFNRFRRHAKQFGAEKAVIDFSYLSAGVSDWLRTFLQSRMEEAKGLSNIGSQRPLEMRL